MFGIVKTVNLRIETGMEKSETSGKQTVIFLLLRWLKYCYVLPLSNSCLSWIMLQSFINSHLIVHPRQNVKGEGDLSLKNLTKSSHTQNT
jgi:hypothetical protein